MKPSKQPAQKSNLDPSEITTLLVAIAQNRDEAAFTRLYEIIGNKAFSLAYQITRSNALAEEAVQEGMLRVWKYAETFDATRNPRNWVLTVVAKAALTISQKRQRLMDHEHSSDLSQAMTTKSNPSGIDQDEEFNGLRKALSALPEAQRKLLLLSFGAGMSQRDIGKTLGLPQRTVSFRIDSILRTLKSNLAQAGFGSVAILLSKHLMVNFTTGYEVPGHLKNQLFSKLDSHSPDTAQGGISATTSISLKWGLGLACTTLAIVCTMGALKLGIFNQVPSETETPIQKEIFRRWVFKEANPQDIKLQFGRWSWRDRKDAKGKSLLASPNPGAIFTPRMEMPKRPFILTLLMNEYLGGDGNFSAFWSDELGSITKNSWKPNYVQVSGSRFQLKIYVFGKWIVCCQSEKEIVVAYKYENAFASPFLSIFLRNQILNEMELRTADLKTFPLTVQQIDATIKKRNFDSFKMVRSSFHRSGSTLMHKHWSFSDGAPKDLKPFNGKWHWRPAKGRDPAGMHMTDRISVKIPMQMPARPMMVTAKLHPLHSGDATFTFRWHASNERLPRHKSWKKHIMITRKTFEWRFLTWDRYIYLFDSPATDPKVIFEYEVPYRGIFCYFSANNFILQELDFQEVSEKDLPAHLKNPTELIKAFEKDGVKPKYSK